MRSLLPKPRRHKLAKGQSDHIDAWLMSYADMITLLCMFFVIFVSMTYSHYSKPHAPTMGEPDHAFIEERSGAMAIKTLFEKTYQDMVGVIATHSADQSVAVEKSRAGIGMDLSATLLFSPESAEIRPQQQPLLNDIAATLKLITTRAFIEVSGHTSDVSPRGGAYHDNWELSSMRAARIASLLVQSGIDPARVRASGYADNQPAVPNEDTLGNPIRENQMRNDRIVIRIEPTPLP